MKRRDIESKTFKTRRPIVAPPIPPPPNKHPGRQAIVNLPRPYKKHNATILKNRRKKELAVPDPDRFRYTVNELDNKVQVQPEGVIAIHLLELTGLSVWAARFSGDYPIFFYCLVSIGQLRRMSKVCLSEKSSKVRMDSTLYISCQLSSERNNFRNKLRIEVWAFQIPEAHYIIGANEMHVYQIVQFGHGIERRTLRTEGVRAGRVAFEFSFAYGVFGYGHSDQLRNTDRSVFESINNSFFPRIRLGDDDSIDNKFGVRTPQQLKTLSPDSFVYEAKPDSKLFTGKKPKNPSDSMPPKYFAMHQVEFEHGVPVHTKINTAIYQKEIEAEFRESYGEYICMTSRRDRYNFLRSLFYGRKEELIESNVAPLFMDMDEGILETITLAEIMSGEKLYPGGYPCKEYPVVFVPKEDEPFFQIFPSTSWSPGYLARIFGYEKLSTDPHYNEDDFAINEVKLKRKSKLGCCYRFRFWVKYIWFKITGAMYSCFNFVFPILRPPPEVPEISLTLASPEGSMTDLYTIWLNTPKAYVPGLNEGIVSIDLGQANFIEEPIGSEEEGETETEDESEYTTMESSAQSVQAKESGKTIKDKSNASIKKKSDASIKQKSNTSIRKEPEKPAGNVPPVVPEKK